MRENPSRPGRPADRRGGVREPHRRRPGPRGRPRPPGPSNDSPQFPPVLAQASLAVTWDRVLADAAFDSEEYHRYAREGVGVRSTVIPINPRGQGRTWPKTTYRRQMAERFRKKPKGSRHRRVIGRRWQVEAVFSRHERRLGSALGGRSDASRERECQLRVLTHNLMILAAHG